VETLGDKIRMARTSLGLTQSQLAERVGVRSLSVHRWESGRTHPSKEHLGRLADCLYESPEYFLIAGAKRADEVQKLHRRVHLLEWEVAALSVIVRELSREQP
jgi:transcriptional regulator with XRE-family HTH domain